MLDELADVLAFRQQVDVVAGGHVRTATPSAWPLSARVAPHGAAAGQLRNGPRCSRRCPPCSAGWVLLAAVLRRDARRNSRPADVRTNPGFHPEPWLDAFTTTTPGRTRSRPRRCKPCRTSRMVKTPGTGPPVWPLIDATTPVGRSSPEPW